MHLLCRWCWAGWRLEGIIWRQICGGVCLPIDSITILYDIQPWQGTGEMQTNPYIFCIIYNDLCKLIRSSLAGERGEHGAPAVWSGGIYKNVETNVIGLELGLIINQQNMEFTYFYDDLLTDRIQFRIHSAKLPNLEAPCGSGPGLVRWHVARGWLAAGQWEGSVAATRTRHWPGAWVAVSPTQTRHRTPPLHCQEHYTFIYINMKLKYI